MERSITVKILGKDYLLKATSEKHEQFIRKAAASINTIFDSYNEKYSGASSREDILVFMALNICMKNLNYQEQMVALQKEAENLEKEMKGYIENIER